MRAAHGSERMTKDVDLDAAEFASTASLRNTIRQSIAKAVKKSPIENATVTEPKQTETTLRWKIGGTLPHGGGDVHLTLEVSRRHSTFGAYAKEVPLAKAFGEQAHRVNIQVLDSHALAATKILALTSESREAIRDLYDLDVLIEAQVATPAALLAGIPNAKETLQKAADNLWQKIESMTYSRFKTEVGIYLPADVANAIDEDSYNEMCIRVATQVETWIQEAESLRAAKELNENERERVEAPPTRTRNKP